MWSYKLKGALALLLVTLVLGGCSSSGPQMEETAPPEMRQQAEPAMEEKSKPAPAPVLRRKMETESDDMERLD